MSVRALRRGSMAGRGAAPAAHHNVAVNVRWLSGQVYVSTSFNPGYPPNPLSATLTPSSDPSAGTPLALTNDGAWGNGYTWVWSRNQALWLMTPYTITVTWADGPITINMPAKTDFDSPGAYPAPPAQPPPP